MKDSVIITNAKETSTVLYIMVTKVRKGSKTLKRLKMRRLLLKIFFSVMEIFDSKQCLFCQRMSEERLRNIMQDSKDIELKTAFRECPSSLQVFKIRSLGAPIQ